MEQTALAHHRDHIEQVLGDHVGPLHRIIGRASRIYKAALATNALPMGILTEEPLRTLSPPGLTIETTILQDGGAYGA